MKVSDAYEANIRRYSTIKDGTSYEGCGIEMLRRGLYRMIVREEYDIDPESRNIEAHIPDTIRFIVSGDHEVFPMKGQHIKPSAIEKFSKKKKPRKRKRKKEVSNNE